MARDLFSDRREAARVLDDLRMRGVNYDAAHANGFRVEDGWRIDDYRQDLPDEQPGPPSEGGSWTKARDLLREYEFVDPAIVRALFRTDEPLNGRTMIFELRFWGLRFHVGVRVVAVTNATRMEDGRHTAVWGWSYRTLEGHLEAGQMDYEVRKWFDTGEVEFRIHAYSRAAHIPNPFVRLGHRVFGRREQTKFARNACERMRRLVEAELAGDGPRSRPDEPGRMVLRPSGAIS